MIKLLIFSPFSLSYGRGGELSIIELALGLSDYFDVTLVDTNKNLGSRQNLLSEQYLKTKLKGIKRDRINFLNFSIYNAYFAIPLLKDYYKLFKHIHNSNIVIFSLTGIGSNLLFILYKYLNLRTKFIVSHRVPLYSGKKRSIYTIRLKISFILFKIFKKRFFHHTISYKRKKYLESFYNPNKVYHILHCVELDKFTNRNVFESEEEILKFIYVGYLDSADKGIDILTESITQLLEEDKNLKVKFEFCGTGPFESDVKRLENIYPNHIKFNGYISYEKIPTFFARNDVFISTSRREAFGRSIIEALASKLLVMCTRTIGSTEILQGKEFAFFLKDLNHQEIKTIILELYNLWLNNREKFDHLKELARNYAIKKYSYSNEINGFLNLIKVMLYDKSHR